LSINEGSGMELPICEEMGQSSGESLFYEQRRLSLDDVTSEDFFYHVIYGLNPQDIARCLCVCSRWRNLIFHQLNEFLQKGNCLMLWETKRLFFIAKLLLVLKNFDFQRHSDRIYDFLNMWNSDDRIFELEKDYDNTIYLLKLFIKLLEIRFIRTYKDIFLFESLKESLKMIRSKD